MSPSERITYRAKDAAAHPELSGADPDATAIAQFVNFVGYVHDIQPGLQRLFPAEVEALLNTEVHRVVSGDSPAVGYYLTTGHAIRSETAAVKRVRIGPRTTDWLFPKVRHAEGAAHRLVVIQGDPMIPDVGGIGRIEQELRGAPVFALRPGNRDVGIHRQPVGNIRRGEFHAINPAFTIIERRENERLPEQSVVELVMGIFVVAVHAPLQCGQ